MCPSAPPLATQDASQRARAGTATPIELAKRVAVHSMDAPAQSNAVVQSVLDACRSVNNVLHVRSVSSTPCNTRIHLRPSNTSDVGALQEMLKRVLPLAKTHVHVSMLDGSVEASIVVPQREEERRAARQLVVRQPLVKVLSLSGYLAVVAAVLVWIAL